MRTEHVVDCSPGEKEDNVSAWDQEIDDLPPDPAQIEAARQQQRRAAAVARLRDAAQLADGPLRHVVTDLLIALGLDE